MARYTKSGTVTTVPEINAELEKIALAQKDFLSRIEENTNDMKVDLDMNSNRILNLPEPIHPTDPLRLQDVYETDVVVGVAEDYLNNAIAEATDRFDPKQLQIIAHRGFRNVDVQNSMLAYSKCKRMGAEVIEADLQVTSDATVVCFHDDTVDALTDGTGSIASLTFAQVQALQFDELNGTDIQSTVSIPAFDDLLLLCQRQGLLLSVEMKNYRTQTDIELMIDKIAEYDFIDKTVISSFDYSDCLFARAYNADIRVGYIGGGSDPLTYEPLFDTMAADNLDFIIWSSASFAGESQVAEYARAVGLKIQAYTIRDVEDAEVCFRKDVYALITDVPLRSY